MLYSRQNYKWNFIVFFSIICLCDSTGPFQMVLYCQLVNVSQLSALSLVVSVLVCVNTCCCLCLLLIIMLHYLVPYSNRTATSIVLIEYSLKNVGPLVVPSQLVWTLLFSFRVSQRKIVCRLCFVLCRDCWLINRQIRAFYWEVERVQISIMLNDIVAQRIPKNRV